MVWGMSLPKGGGPYGPDGEYEGPVDVYGDGWRHRLQAYYRDEMPEDQRVLFKDGYGGGAHYYPSFVWGKFIHRVGTTDGPDRLPFTPIEAHEPPRFFQTSKGYDLLASVISLPGRVWAIDQLTKTVIERLDPGVHQFYPLEIRMPRGRTYPTLYYTLVFGRYLDSVSPECSKQGSLRPNGPNKYFSDESKKAISGRAFSRERFGKANLWREHSLGEWMACISNELHDEFTKAGLWLPRHYRMIEV